MAGLPAGTIAVEYTVATGPFFPTSSSVAQDTSASAMSSGTTSSATVGSSFPLNPAVGQTVYNTSLGHLYVWDGATWKQA